MNIAVITGASSGLGKEFAGFVDVSCAWIDEIWLIARREERLNEIASGLEKKTKVLAMDLTKADSIDELKNTLNENMFRFI